MSVEVVQDNALKLIEGLNDRQKEAVQQLVGSTVVIAGAGSGKTAVLTRRVAFFVAKGEKPGHILCLTFTNKAAGEMNNRVYSMLEGLGYYLPRVPSWKNDYTQAPLLCTFHSLGVRLLREYGEKLGLSNAFTILDSEDQKRILRGILKDLNVDQKNLPPSLALYFISQCKQHLLVAGESRKLSKEYMDVFHTIYKRYEETLAQSQAVDFDDLILRTYILLRDNEDVQLALRERWKHVLVDEFQDTNQPQFEILKLLMPTEFFESWQGHGGAEPEYTPNEARSFFVVGDDAQSIYRFRGSKVEIILNFEHEYPGSKEIVLNQNYRSTQKILDLAEKVLTLNPNQKQKNLFADNPYSTDVNYYTARNEKDEVEFIIRQLYQLYVKQESFDNEISYGSTVNASSGPVIDYEPDEVEVKKADSISSMFDIYMNDIPKSSQMNYNPSSWQVPELDWSDVTDLNNVVVLYRTNGQSRSIEETFLKYNVPYRLVSGVRFLDRREIKDMMAILRFLSNSADKVSLSRFLPLVMDGVGPKTLEKIFAYLDDFDYPLPAKVAQELASLMTKMQNSWNNSDSLIGLTKELLVTTGYARYLKKLYPIKEERLQRMENIGELYSLMFTFDEDTEASVAERLQRFLEHITLMSNQENAEESDTPKVNLMTLHQSKGLEYETVFMVGVEDGILPHQNSLNESDGLEEEVRLAYVGVTRAKRHLYLVSADSRIQYGQVKSYPVSRIFRPFMDNTVKRVR
jgi:DNA helicase II / ATP-dependent DNA helicase PcrA